MILYVAALLILYPRIADLCRYVGYTVGTVLGLLVVINVLGVLCRL